MSERKATMSDASISSSRGIAREFLRSRRAVSAVEFAFVSPVALVLLLMGFDMGRFVLATQRVETVAETMAQMLAETAPNANAQTSGDGLVSASDIFTIYNSAFFIYPDILNQSNTSDTQWYNALQASMASVKFTATPSGCTSACTYVPKVVWNYGTGPKRACGSTITAVADTATITPTTLPQDVFGPNSLVVVDITYTFQPTFGANYFPGIAIQRSTYLVPRNVPLVEATAMQNIVTVCS